MRLPALVLALAVTAAHAAEPLSPQDLAKVSREMKKAADAVSKKYGDKKLKDLPPDERKAMMKEQADAQRAVLEKNNLDPRDLARAEARTSGKDLEAASKALEAKEAEAAKKNAGTPGATAAPAARDGDVNEAAAMDKAMGLGKGKK